MSPSQDNWTPMSYEQAHKTADMLNADQEDNWVYTVHHTNYHASTYYVQVTDENGHDLGRLNSES